MISMIICIFQMIIILKLFLALIISNLKFSVLIGDRLQITGDSFIANIGLCSCGLVTVIIRMIYIIGERS